MLRKLIVEILAGVIVVVGCTGCTQNYTTNNREKVEDSMGFEEGKEEKMDDSAELIEPELLIEDLKFMYDEYMSKNLSSEEDESIIAEFNEKYDELVQSINEPMSIEEFYFEVSKLAAVTNNAHATVRYNGETEFLPYEFKWIEEGLVVTSSNDNVLELGDKIIMIGDKNTEAYIPMLNDITASENEYWIKNTGAKKLVQKGILQYFSAVEEDGSVSVLIEKEDGSTVERALNFEEREISTSPTNNEVSMAELIEKAKRNGNSQKREEVTEEELKEKLSKVKTTRKSKVSYEILEEYDTGVLKVESCFFDQTAKETIEEFFNKVMENDISEVVLDLRDNPGGPTKVIDEFLKYIQVDEVQYWKNTEVDFGVKTIEHYNDNLFEGDIYVATSNGTFSAGHMFAATLKYNNLATTIGEPTGQSDKFYGRAGKSTLPNTGIIIGTTTVTVYMQNEEYPETLAPDIYIPLTVQDIVNEKDPIKEWIKNKE